MKYLFFDIECADGGKATICQSVEKRSSRESREGVFGKQTREKGEKSKEIGGMVISPLSFCEFF